VTTTETADFGLGFGLSIGTGYSIIFSFGFDILCLTTNDECELNFPVQLNAWILDITTAAGHGTSIVLTTTIY
jgi:hypothetical protein